MLLRRLLPGFVAVEGKEDPKPAEVGQPGGLEAPSSDDSDGQAARLGKG
jgi:hypothetical protein